MITLNALLSNLKSAQEEALICFCLDHPNVVKYFDHFQYQNSYCIVMEFVKGEGLRQFINQIKQTNQYLPEQTVVKLFSQIVSVTKYIHDHKILHRDLKPENIFINDDFSL
jgi:serine/threonine protein kinase